MPGDSCQLVVLHQGAIGDFVLAHSAIQAVRSRLSAGRVLAIANAASARFAAGRSAVDLWRSPEAVGMHSLFGDASELDERLRATLISADCILSFLGDGAQPLHGRLCAATEAKVISIDPRPTVQTIQDRLHITRQWARAIRNGGLDIDEPTPPIIRVARQGNPTPNIVVHPGAGSPRKCWPVESFIRAVDALDYGQVSWMLGPAELESDHARFALIKQRIETKHDRVIVEDDLATAAMRIADADVYIGNDAGMTHVAAAMGLRTVALFGPTDPHVWRPLGEHVAVVATDQPGDPMTAITLDRVNAAVRQRGSSLF